MTKRKHIINVHTSTGTTAPTGASLYLGEIAVQHKATDPALWIKVGAAESSTQYEKFVGEKAVTSAISQAVSSSLTGVSMNGSEVSVANNVAVLGTVITAETQLSTATTGTGNVVGSIAVSNHKVTSTMFSAASADQISKLSGATQSHTVNTAAHTTDAEKTRWNNAWTSGVSAYTKVEALSAATTGISKNLTDLSAVTITGVTQNGTSVVSNKVAAIVETSVSTANGTTSDTPAAVVTGITTGGTKGHTLTLAKTNKVFSAATSDSALTVLSAVTSLSAQTAILGPNYTYSGISYVNSATSVADAYSALTNEMINDEKAISAAFNDLNTRVNEISAATHGQGGIESITLNGDEYTGTSVNLGTVVRTETQLSKGTTTGTGNVVTDLSVSNHQITLAKSFSAAPADQFVTLSGAAHNKITALSSATVAHINSAASHVSATDRTTWNGKQDTITDLSTIRNNALSGASAYTRVNALSAATTAHTGNNNIHVTSAEKTAWTNGANSGASAYTRVNELSAATVGISAKTAHMLTMQLNGTQVGQYSPSADTTINMKVDGTNVMLTSAYTMNTGTSRVALEVTSADSTTAAFGKVSKVIYLDELITSSALNDLNDRVYELEQGGGAASEDLLELSGVVIDLETTVADNYTELSNRIDNMGGGALSSAYTMATGSTEQQLSLHSGDTFEAAFGKMEKREYDNELVIAAALNVLNNNIQGIQGLPAVTSADNGKILAVVNGQWALVSLNDLLNNN